MMGWNTIAVEKDGATSRLIRALGFPPLKFINPRAQQGCCQVYISNYGGGLVDGDEIRMRVDCLPGARMYLGTQSSTKVYKSNGKGGCLQETVGTVHARALAVVCPDPVVPFAGSRYRQTQVWEVHPDADFVLFDWLQPGRSARGEVFAYGSVRTELRIKRPGGDPVLIERFELSPETRDPFRCGHFGGFRSLLCVYFIGPRISRLIESLEADILALNRRGQDRRTADGPGEGRSFGPIGDRYAGPGEGPAGRSVPEAEPGKGSDTHPQAVWIGMGKREGEGWMIRAMGGDRRDLQPLHDLIFAALADAAWLGFNPWKRRW